jgi:hypothetical protein
LVGGLGNDYIDGGQGNDIIDESSDEYGSNILIGGAGNDKITGGCGDDVIDPGKDLDEVDAGCGDDTIIIRPGDVPSRKNEIIICGDEFDTDRVIFQGFRRSIQTSGNLIIDPYTRGTYELIGCEEIIKR